MITILPINTERTYEIRKKVLRNNINLPIQFIGDFDENTFHLGIFKNKILAGIITLMKNKGVAVEGSQYQLRGMAIKKEFQNQGLGKHLLLEVETILKQKKCTVIWCNARIIALPFYKKLKFKVIGNEFDIPKIGLHFKMYKTLKNNKFAFAEK